jgi:hypothetical protein
VEIFICDLVRRGSGVEAMVETRCMVWKWKKADWLEKEQ